jgi:hypothetical protein
MRTVPMKVKESLKRASPFAIQGAQYDVYVGRSVYLMEYWLSIVD